MWSLIQTPIGNGLALIGDDDYMAVPDSPSFDVGTGNLSVFLWVRRGTPAPITPLVDPGSACSPY